MYLPILRVLVEQKSAKDKLNGVNAMFFVAIFFLLIFFIRSICCLFVCVVVLRPSQPNGVMSSAVSLPNHTFTGQA